MAKQVLIPQFSIRWLLIVTAACAVVFSVFGLAVRGHHWAAGVSIAIVALVVALLVHAAVFGLVWLFSEMTSPLRGRLTGPGRSPFARDATARGVRGPGALGDATSTTDKDTPAAPIILD